MLWVKCAGCRHRFPVSPRSGHWAPLGPQVFVCDGCAEAAINPVHSRSAEVLERLAAALSPVSAGANNQPLLCQDREGRGAGADFRGEP